MADKEPHLKHYDEDGFLQKNIRKLAELAGNTALLGVAIIATGFAYTEVIFDFDEQLSTPFDNE